MQIRVAVAADVAPLDALFQASYPVLLAPDYPDALLQVALPIIAHAQPALVTCGSYYVAERDGRLLGAGGWTHEKPASGAVEQGLAHIRHVAVDHAATRQGVAAALLGRVFEDAAAAGVTRLSCMSTLTAVPFYRAMGFRVVNDVTIPLAPGCDFPAVEMVRDL